MTLIESRIWYNLIYTSAIIWWTFEFVFIFYLAIGVILAQFLYDYYGWSLYNEPKIRQGDHVPQNTLIRDCSPNSCRIIVFFQWIETTAFNLLGDFPKNISKMESVRLCLQPVEGCCIVAIPVLSSKYGNHIFVNLMSFFDLLYFSTLVLYLLLPF